MSNDLTQWVDECIRMTSPGAVHWCDGSPGEYERLIQTMLTSGTLIELDQKKHPGCYLHRSDPNDVARTEHLTFVCTSKKEDAGPNNNWMSPEEAKAKVRPLFVNAMKDRTMYVIPYLMGPVGSPHSKVGVEITDSAYVAANMHIMTRVGKPALDRLQETGVFVPGLHSLGDLSPDRRFILHFPEEPLIWSVGSGYGGNALLGKKCFALRIASHMALKEGWMAEHMLIIGIEDPSGEVTYLAAAFPSASGKTNLAMLVSTLADEGYRVWTVGDDIAWLFPGADGRLWAVNPEAGFFGVAPGTGVSTNPVAMATIERNTIFTNVAMTADGSPWWEGIGPKPASGLVDWRGNAWDGTGTAAHPNSRFTAPARQCPTISSHWQDPQGVPISAFVFGSRRSNLIPIVYEAFNWQHGVFIGAGMGGETTAAATGMVGVVRRDPMAMLPFCGYNMGDYFGHWLEMGKRLAHPPKIFRVNWFLKDDRGKFIWPGFGDNIRVFKWILERINGRGEAAETPLGFMPTERGIDMRGLALSDDAKRQLLHVDRAEWLNASDRMEAFFKPFGDRMPEGIWSEWRAFRKRMTER
jgi:phosphoenolpyruvate carboxykinase (GTP)